MILLEGVTRDFGPVRVLTGLDLAVRRGETMGLLGHDGAGKTTTLRLVAGLLRPTQGRVRVDGLDPVADGPLVRRRLGVLPAAAAVDERLTARDNLRFAAALFDLPRSGLEGHLDVLLDRVGLADRADDAAGTLPTGMRRRLSLARALLHDPDVLLLDEPTAAMDPDAARRVRTLIVELAAGSSGPGGARRPTRTIVLGTHDLDEAQRLCHRVAVLEHGRVRALGTPAQLARRWGSDLEVEVDPEDLAASLALGPVAGVRPQRRDERRVRFEGIARVEVPRIVQALAGAGVRVYGVEVRVPSLEEASRRLHETEDAR